MKYLRILIDPIKVKGDLDDEEQLQADVYQKLTELIESEVLSFTVDEEDDSEELDF